VDDLEKFIEFLKFRIMDEVFYEVISSNNHSGIKNEEHYEIIFHFLAKIDQNTILYETKQDISKRKNISTQKVINDLFQGVLNQVDISIKLVKGKIREIFLSYSS